MNASPEPLNQDGHERRDRIESLTEDLGQAVILNVDDNDVSRYARTRILEQAGFQVREAGTGSDGLRLAAEGVDVIILDVHLPDLNGFEVCRRLKADPATRGIPVLQVSASFVRGEHRIFGLEGGADAYLVQPVEPAELLATVRALLRTRRAEQEMRALARQWQITFDAMHDGVCLLDENGTVLRCNRALARLLDRPANSLVGQSQADLFPELAGEQDRSPFDRMRHTCRRESLEGALRERWLRITADPVLDDDGKLTGAVLILADLTEREREQRRAERAEADARLKAERIEQLEQERRLFDLFAALPPAAVTARLFGAVSLRESSPEVFGELERQYGRLLDLAIEQREYRVEHSLTEKLRAFAERLGFLRAGPRDLIEIHSTALERIRTANARIRAQVYHEEGRLLVLEVMGHLAAYYRSYYLGARRPAHTEPPVR